MSDRCLHFTGGTAIVTAEGTLVSWDKEAARCTGYTFQEVQGLGFLQLFEPAAVMHYLLNQALEERPTTYSYLELQCRDHVHKMVFVHTSAQVSSRDTRAKQIMVTFREVAPTQQQRQQTSHLEKLGQLAGVLSHEIRNPMSVLILHIDLLQETLQGLLPSVPAEVHDIVQELQTGISRIHELIEDYLSLTRLIHLQHQPDNLLELLAEVVQSLAAPLTKRDIAVRLEGTGTNCLISCHRNSLRRALLNLLQNAIDAMPHGGTLTLSSWQEQNCFHLLVSDSGIGIPEHELSQVFLPFHTTKPEGTGLGLYVVREIIEAHGGTIEVASKLGQGTMFTVKLPCCMPEESD